MSCVTGIGSESNPIITREWITPEAQLKEFRQGEVTFFVTLLMGTNNVSGPLPIREIAMLVAEYVAEAMTYLTHWHTALNRLQIPIDLVPALSFKEIYPILKSVCPLRDGELKKDGTPYLTIDSHFLFLMPPIAFYDLVNRVKAYGGDVFLAEGNVITASVTIPSEVPYWILISHDVLPGSTIAYEDSDDDCNEWFDKLITDVSKRSSIRYIRPSIIETVAFAFFRTITMGITRLTQEEDYWTFTKEQRIIYQMPFRLTIDHTAEDTTIGTLALRMFGVPMREMVERHDYP